MYPAEHVHNLHPLWMCMRARDVSCSIEQADLRLILIQFGQLKEHSLALALCDQ